MLVAMWSTSVALISPPDLTYSQASSMRIARPIWTALITTTNEPVDRLPTCDQLPAAITLQLFVSFGA